jgi:hypothetical protein
MEVKYLNTDLEIESKHDLSRILEEFGEEILVHHHGEIRGYQHLSFSIAGSRSGADEVINYFCSLVDSLPEEVREIWDRSCSRVIDIGYESGTSPQSFRSEIKASTIQRVSEISASIMITIYPLFAEDSAQGDTTP